MSIEKHGKTYRLQVRRGGRVQWVDLGATTIREAKRAAERLTALLDREKATKQLTRKLCEYALALARGELRRDMLGGPLRALEAQAALEVLPVVAELFPAPPVTAAELWARYLATKPEVKPVTIKTRRQRYAIFEKWSGERDASELTVADCRRFISAVRATGQTLKNYLSDLSVVFTAAGVADPWKSPELRPKHIEHKETAPMPVMEAKKLLEYCDGHAADMVAGISLDRWAAFLRAFYYSGQRPVDVCHFEYQEFDGVVIDLMPEKTSRTRRHVNYKADPRLRQLLNALPRTNERYFFPEFARLYDLDRGRPGREFSKLAQLAGIPRGLTLYGFRHAFITYQLDAGAEDTDVAAAVGHSSTETTKRHYYHGKKTVELQELPEI